MDIQDRIRLKRKRRLRAIAIGALLAVSVYLVEAGVAEILLARDNQCRAAVFNQRLFMDPNSVCMPEWQQLMLQATTQGVLGLVRPEAPALAVWLVMIVLYAGLGGFCARLPTRWALGVFFVVNVGSIALLAGLMYLSRFIG
jgi:hypothetical protein